MAWAAFTALAMISGCGSGDGLPREPVQGTVTLAGEPLESGMISFDPGSADLPTTAGAVIADGRYEVPRQEGLVPGTYRVMIYSQGAETPLPEDHVPGAPMPLPQDLIPPRYNAQTELSVEVKSGGPNEFDFPLEP